MYKKLLTIAFVFTACIDFDIDAPYDDINGIYLEYVRSYDFSGWKIAAENEKGYILDDTYIVCYDLTDAYRIDTLSVYQSVYPKSDFAIADGYAYIASPYYLEIVDFNQTTPHLAGSLSISGILYSIILSDANAFITGSTKIYNIDITNTASPEYVAEYTFDDSVIKAEVDTDTLYVLLVGGDLQIIDIATPTSPQLIAQHNLSDSLSNADHFVKHNGYLYATRGFDIDAYEIQINGALEYQNTLSFSHGIQFLRTYGDFGLALYDGFLFNRLYLLNLTYPSRPCIGEFYELLENPDYATAYGQYIYILSPSLDILEMKVIEQ